MHFSTLAVAAAGLFTTALAADEGYYWTVTDWTYDDSARTYSLSISAPKATEQRTPAFTATCSGTVQGGFAGCGVTTSTGDKVLSVSVDVKVVPDVDDWFGVDRVPRVTIKSEWPYGPQADFCAYTYQGHHDQSDGDRTAFRVYPSIYYPC
jgi:hypothetical protein